MTKKIRQLVYEKYEGHCAYCGMLIHINNMQVDHIKPKRNFSIDKRKGYQCLTDIDDINNLNPSCGGCNNFKSAMSLDEFRSELQKQVERARRYSVNFRLAEKYKQIQIFEFPIKFYFETHGE